MADVGKPSFSGYALFCHPQCYFGNKIPQTNKNPHQNEQIHDQKDAVNPCDSCISSLGSNIVESISIRLLHNSLLGKFYIFKQLILLVSHTQINSRNTVVQESFHTFLGQTSLQLECARDIPVDAVLSGASVHLCFQG